MKNILISIIAIFLICSLIFVYQLRQHWCSEINVKKITLNAENLGESSMYQCTDKSLVIWLQKDNIVIDVFVVNTEMNKVGDVNSSSFFNFKNGIISWEMPLKPVFLGEIQAKNDDIKPELTIETNRIEFSPYNNDKKVVIEK
jgi:peptidoglycan hydrolase-like amidase